MDFYSDDDSDPDFDEGLQEDLDLVRRSCIIAGADPDAAVAQASSYLTVPAATTTAAAAAAKATDGSSDEGEGEDEDEDLALVRSIRENLHLNKASPSSPRPICAWPPSDAEDDEEDDLETLRAIQRRFSHYHSGTSTGPLENMKNEASKGGDDEFIAHQPGEEDVQKKNMNANTQTGFPKAALLLVDALKKNRACQKFIRRKMINIEAKIEVNKDLRDRVKCLMDYQYSCRRSFGKVLCQKVDPRVRLISSQKQSAQSAKNKYKTPALLLGPAENPHVEKYKAVLKQFPVSLQKHPWSDIEKDRLAKGIKQQYQEALIKDSMKNGSSSGDFSAVDMAYALTNTVGNFEATPEILRSVLPLVNWDYVAAMYLPGRSGAECESRWLNHDDPLINHKAWTACEEKRLILTVQEKGMHNWINIAVALGTQRTPFQCLARYQRSLNPHILKRTWTKEEDLQLLAAVQTFGCNWQLVSANLVGRIGNQCSNRYRKTLIPERKRVGRWSEDEDKRLMVSVKLFRSGSWNKIAQFVPGRTQSQCSERWRNVLDPDIEHGEWRPEEDSKLLASVHEVGPCWSKIAGAMIPHRTDNMCLRRWKRLCQDELPLMIAANQVKKSIFQTNFVDRETERPAICPSDFPSLVYSKVDKGDENTVRIGAENQTGEDITVSDGVNNSSRCHHSKARKRKVTTDGDVVVQPGMRGSISVDKELTLDILGGPISFDNEAPTNQKRDPTSVGKEGTAKKRTRGSVSVGNEGAVKKKMRGSISVGDGRAVKNRMRGSVSIDNQGNTTKRKRVSRKSAKGNSKTDGEVNTCEMDLPSVPSEAAAERGIHTGNTNKMKRKSTPRPKLINMAEGTVDEYSRLADCISFARGNGTSKNNSVMPINNAVQSGGPSGENLQMTIIDRSNFLKLEKQEDRGAKVLIEHLNSSIA
uniref:Myb-like protein L n=1 Tax=Aegilops tauschii TaxID=37682 RepID=M8B0J4_AEGTA